MPSPLRAGGVAGTKLTRYDAARTALQQAHAVDEAQEIRNRAEALRAYARQAKDTDLENWAAEIKLRAERRAGELLKVTPRAPGGTPYKRGVSTRHRVGQVETLAEHGVTRNDSATWQALADVPEDRFEDYIQTERAKAKPISSRQATTTLTKSATRAKRDKKRKARTWPEDKYGLIYTDPPWQPVGGVLDPTRKIENQYPTMSREELLAMADPVKAISAKACALAMWTTSQKIGEACELIDAWGFTVQTGAVWVKPSIGIGFWFRQRHELLVLATVGKPMTPNEEDRPDSVLEAPRRGHSEKPEEMYARLELMFGDIPRIELFARPPYRDG